MKEKILDEILATQGPLIDTLEYQVNEDRYGNVYGTNPPSTDKIVDKINEIVLRVNNLDFQIYEIIKYLKHD